MKPKRSLKFYIRKYTAKILKAPFMVLPGSLRDKALGWLRTTAVWKSLGSSDYSKLSGTMRETFVKSVTEYLESSLPNIPHEVLLLWGRNDDATPVYQGQRIEKGIENSALVIIEDAGHYAFLDKPKQFARIAEAFFKG
jgi:pimeloyl-ACP methyl ester carboxylesterase